MSAHKENKEEAYPIVNDEVVSSIYKNKDIRKSFIRSLHKPENCKEIFKNVINHLVSKENLREIIAKAEKSLVDRIRETQCVGKSVAHDAKMAELFIIIAGGKEYYRQLFSEEYKKYDFVLD